MAIVAEIVARLEIVDITVCRCHPEDAIRWGFYSGDYIRLIDGDVSVYALLNPPPETLSEDEEDHRGSQLLHVAQSGEESGPAPGQVWVSAALHALLGHSDNAVLELAELEEAVAVWLSGDLTLNAAADYFGLTSSTRSLGAVGEAAEAAGIDVNAEVVAHWQRYVDSSRCPMRPVWPGMQFASGSAVDAIAGANGSKLDAGIVMPTTSLLFTGGALDRGPAPAA